MTSRKRGNAVSAEATPEDVKTETQPCVVRTPKVRDCHSPDLDVLTPAGCRALLQVGDKALAVLINRGLPHIEVSNSYRFVRARVLEWLSTEGEQSRRVQTASFGSVR